MTLSTTTSRVPAYAGTGSTGPFAVPFRFLDETHLQVVRRSSVGVDTVLTLGSQYSTTGAGTVSGTVTLVTALAVGESLHIRRKPPLTQPTSIRNQGAYFPATIEDEFDRLVMQMQSMQDEIDRSVKLSETFPGSAALTSLEPSAGKVVTGTGTGYTMSALDAGAIAIPGQGRTVATLSAYLANNGMWFNPKDFGAAWDNVADDSAEIQATIDAASVTYGGKVVLPPGTAKYATGLTIDAAVEVAGSAAHSGPAKGQAGAATTVLSYTGSGVAITLIGSGAEGKENIHLHDFTLLGTVAATGGILLGSTWLIVGSSIKNVQVTGFSQVGGYGIRFQRCLATTLENVLCRNNYDGFLIDAGAIVTTLRFFSCYSYTNLRNGCRFLAGYTSQFFGLINESNDSDGMYLGGCEAFEFFGYYSEDNNRTGGTAPIMITGGATRHTFFGGSIADAGVSGRYIDIDNASVCAFYDLRLPGVIGAIRVTVNTIACKWFTASNDMVPSNVVGNGINRMIVSSGTIPSRYQKLAAANGFDGEFAAFTKGVIVITDLTNNKTAIYSLNGALNTVTLMLNPDGGFKIGAGQAGFVNIYWGGSAFRIGNNTGGAIDLIASILNADGV